MEDLSAIQLINYYTTVEPNQEKAGFYKFLSVVEKRGNVRTDMNPCWLTPTKSSASAGYKQIMINAVPWNCHRYSFYAYNKFVSLEKGKHVCHKCDNKECCNPEHLYLGTPKDNSNDVFTRGIRKSAPIKENKNGHKNGKLFTSEGASGENNIKAILNWEQVREIRRRKELGLKYGELKKMAEEFGIKYITIQKIVANKLWIEKE